MSAVVAFVLGFIIGAVVLVILGLLVTPASNTGYITQAELERSFVHKRPAPTTEHPTCRPNNIGG